MKQKMKGFSIFFNLTENLKSLQPVALLKRKNTFTGVFKTWPVMQSNYFVERLSTACDSIVEEKRTLRPVSKKAIYTLEKLVYIYIYICVYIL